MKFGNGIFWSGRRFSEDMMLWAKSSSLSTTISGAGYTITKLYSALSQDGKLVVEDIPLAVGGRCFGKVGGVIAFLFGPVRRCHQMGPQCLLTPPGSASSIYAAVVYVLGSVCYIWSTSPVLFGVLCEFKCALSNSLFLCFFLSLGGPEP